jgi:hypothetical protein
MSIDTFSISDTETPEITKQSYPNILSEADVLLLSSLQILPPIDYTHSDEKLYYTVDLEKTDDQMFGVHNAYQRLMHIASTFSIMYNSNNIITKYDPVKDYLYILSDLQLNLWTHITVPQNSDNTYIPHTTSQIIYASILGENGFVRLSSTSIIVYIPNSKMKYCICVLTSRGISLFLVFILKQDTDNSSYFRPINYQDINFLILSIDYIHILQVDSLYTVADIYSYCKLFGSNVCVKNILHTYNNITYTYHTIQDIIIHNHISCPPHPISLFPYHMHNLNVDKINSKKWKIIPINKQPQNIWYCDKEQVKEMYALEHIYYPENVDVLLDETSDVSYLFDTKRPFVRIDFEESDKTYFIPLTDLIHFYTHKYETFILFYTPIQERMLFQHTTSIYVENQRICRLIRTSLYQNSLCISSVQKNYTECLNERINNIQDQLQYLRYKFMVFIRPCLHERQILSIYSTIYSLEAWNTEAILYKITIHVLRLLSVITPIVDDSSEYSLLLFHDLLNYMYVYLLEIFEYTYSPLDFETAQKLQKKYILHLFSCTTHTVTDDMYIKNNQYTTNKLVIFLHFLLYTFYKNNKLIQTIEEEYETDQTYHFAAQDEIQHFKEYVETKTDTDMSTPQPTPQQPQSFAREEKSEVIEAGVHRIIHSVSPATSPQRIDSQEHDKPFDTPSSTY